MINGEELLSLPLCFELRIHKSHTDDFVILTQVANCDENSEVWIHPIQVASVIAALQKFADAHK